MDLELLDWLNTYTLPVEFNAVVLDDSGVPAPYEISIENRMERAVYLSLDTSGLRAKYVAGTRIF